MIVLPTTTANVRQAQFSYRDDEEHLARIVTSSGHVRWVAPTPENFPRFVEAIDGAIDILISR